MPENPPKPRWDFLTRKFEYRKGRWIPLWAILIVPFLILFEPLYRYVKDEVNWKAAFGTVVIFELLLLCAEYYSLKRGHWVYNEARILGPKIFGIPIEEPLLYYLFPPLIIISLMHGVKKVLRKGQEKAPS
ncbi:MAG: lycopene cyclase domain-containing protein [Elusimicrobia bacterium]|nr:lycopene cyclase domain-containing protein [Candidatus Obscuribacterium magneticum]